MSGRFCGMSPDQNNELHVKAHGQHEFPLLPIFVWLPLLQKEVEIRKELKAHQTPLISAWFPETWDQNNELPVTADELHEFPLLQKEAEIQKELKEHQIPLIFVWLMNMTNTQENLWTDQADEAQKDQAVRQQLSAQGQDPSSTREEKMKKQCQQEEHEEHDLRCTAR